MAALHIDGEHAIQRARLIAFTGYGSDEHRRLAIDAGFDEHVVKPIDLAALTRWLA